MKKYTTLFVDLDGTIFDFLTTENIAVKATFKKNGAEITEEQAKRYSDINLSYWEKYERGEIKKEDIYVNRFITFTERENIDVSPEKISEDYFGELASRHILFEGAWETLEYLKDKGYYLCATTNGVSKTQYRRVRESGIDKFFDLICVSEDAKAQKPSKEYFDYVISKCPEKDKNKILVIGDSQSSDVLGAINSGLSVCFNNYYGEKRRFPVTYEVNNITELKNIL